MKTPLLALVLSAALTFALPAFAQAPAPAPAPAMKTAPSMMKSSPSMMKSSPSMMKAAPLDINSASEDDLKAMKGVGDVRAKAIIKGRPYKGKDDLVAKNIIPQKVYDDIKDKIIAKQK